LPQDIKSRGIAEAIIDIIRRDRAEVFNMHFISIAVTSFNCAAIAMSAILRILLYRLALNYERVTVATDHLCQTRSCSARIFQPQFGAPEWIQISVAVSMRGVCIFNVTSHIPAIMLTLKPVFRMSLRKAAHCRKLNSKFQSLSENTEERIYLIFIMGEDFFKYTSRFSSCLAHPLPEDITLTFGRIYVKEVSVSYSRVFSAEILRLYISI